MKPIFFSIIIPLYNKEHFIKETINSVLQQTYQHYEIIVVDDGSTDNSLKVAKDIKDDRISIYPKQNEGVSIARNVGAAKAKYNYLIFLDGDDVWQSDFLENMVSLVNKYPQVSLYATATKWKVGNNVTTVNYKGFKQDGIIHDYCWETFRHRKTYLCVTGAVCVTKEIFDKVGGFPPKVRKGEDIDTWLRILCHTDMAFSNDAYFTYNVESENNANIKSASMEGQFPYWKWYSYKYHNKISLYLMTDLKILFFVKEMIKYKNIKEGFRLLSMLKLF